MTPNRTAVAALAVPALLPLPLLAQDCDPTQLFTPQAVFGVGDEPSSVAIVDLDGDGNGDLVVTNQLDSTVSVLLGNGDGTFAAEVVYDVGNRPSGVAIADLNGDGNGDLAVSNRLDENVSVLLNNGDGTFAAKVDYRTGDSPVSVAIGDLDGDGDNDIAVAD